MIKHVSLLILMFIAAPCMAFQEIVEDANARAGVESQISQWGLGVGVGVEFYKDQYIEDANLIGTNRKVVVSKSYDSSPSVWAVGTWTPYSCGSFLDRHFCKQTFKPGIYVGAKVAGQEDALDAFSIGLQMTFLERGEFVDKSGNTAPAFKPSWVIGAGWVNHSTREFAGDIQENQDLPADYDDIQYREGRDNGWMLMVTKVLGGV